MNPKSKFLTLSAGMAFFLLPSNRAAADELATQNVPAASKAETIAPDTKMLEKLSAAKKEIIDRTGMSSLLEQEQEPDNDPRIDQKIAESLKEGWIVAATVEEVAAALARAAATPSHEDDAAAMELAHRGSYRFYFSDKGSETSSPPADRNPK